MQCNAMQCKSNACRHKDAATLHKQSHTLLYMHDMAVLVHKHHGKERKSHLQVNTHTHPHSNTNTYTHSCKIRFTGLLCYCKNQRVCAIATDDRFLLFLSFSAEQQWKFAPAWVRGLRSRAKEGNVQPIGTAQRAQCACSCCFSSTGSYVLSHFPLDNPSLHKTCNQLSGYSEGTQRLGSNTVTSAHGGRTVERGKGRGREENPALLFSARTARSECVVGAAGGSEEGWGKRMVVVVFNASRSYHIHRFWGSFESLLHKTLSRFSST